MEQVAETTTGKLLLHVKCTKYCGNSDIFAYYSANLSSILQITVVLLKRFDLDELRRRDCALRELKRVHGAPPGLPPYAVDRAPN